MSAPFVIEPQPDVSINCDGCFWCGIPCPPESVCPLCVNVRFCSEEHLRNHYYFVPRHKESNNNNNDRQCLPYRIGFDASRGRFAIATRDIEPTELIMADWPMVVGPSRQQKIVCVECLLPVNGSVRCPDCNFPLCSLDCPFTDTAVEPEHPLKWHRQYECRLLSKIDFRAATKNLQCRNKASTEVPLLLAQIASLTPLRLLLKGLRGEPGTQDLVRGPLYNFCAPEQLTTKIYAFEEDMVDVIWNDFRMKDQVSDIKVVRQAIGQIFNNAKSLEKSGFEGTGLFGLYSVLNHSCISNAKCIVGPVSRGYPLEVRAQVRIAAGEEITTRYVGVNIGAPMRADMLKEHWMFVCACKRCQDPTDCGTFASAIRCPKCKINDAVGYLLPHGKFGASSYEWSCSRCFWKTEKSFIEKIIDYGLGFIRRTTSAGTPTTGRLVEMIETLEKIFHPRHYLILQMKFVLVCVVRNQRDDSNNVTLVRLCMDLLSSLDVLDPGASRNRGKILKDLIPSYMKHGKSQHESGQIDDGEYQRIRDQCTSYAKDLVSCFKYEFL